jgi:hypothetical protein
MQFTHYEFAHIKKADKEFKEKLQPYIDAIAVLVEQYSSKNTAYFPPVEIVNDFKDRLCIEMAGTGSEDFHTLRQKPLIAYAIEKSTKILMELDEPKVTLAEVKVKGGKIKVRGRIKEV